MMGCSNLMGHFGKALFQQQPGFLIQGAEGSLEHRFLRHDIPHRSGVETADGEQRRLHGGYAAGNQRLQSGYQFRPCHQRIMAFFRGGAVAALAKETDGKHIHCRADGHRRGPQGEGWIMAPHMDGKKDVHIVDQPGFKHLIRAAFPFLGRLENNLRLSLPFAHAFL